jgi:hypothetical protein
MSHTSSPIDEVEAILRSAPFVSSGRAEDQPLQKKIKDTENVTFPKIGESLYVPTAVCLPLQTNKTNKNKILIHERGTSKREKER